jgi:hypothetical protein
MISELPITYLSSKRRVIGLILGSGAFVAVAIFIYGKHPFVASLCGGFFGLCALVGLVNLHPGAGYLTLRADGFEFASVFRKTFVRWNDVEAFVPITMSGNKFVAWNYVQGYDAHEKMRRINVSVSGVEAMLPDTYGFKHEELAARMNELRETARRGV